MIRILFCLHNPSSISKHLDLDHGGLVFYPKSSGQSWSFHAQKWWNFRKKLQKNIFRRK
ncbi:DUF771 domain-containing protein [Bacillus andreraoultii]|uniref:DUF771 domain-containing protein n=1 Tax=Bacillus andreraoultii TaxID=1499685 RepID=UPI0038992019